MSKKKVVNKNKQRPVILPRKIVRKPMLPQSPVGMSNASSPGTLETNVTREAKIF